MGVLILVFILLIMVGGLMYDAAHLVADDIHGNERDFAPLTALVAAALGGIGRSAAQTVSEVGWWLHNVTVLAFLCLLPLSKHFHIITAIPNVFLGKLPPRGAERPLAVTHVPAAPVAALDAPPEGLVGVASLADVSWKQVLDAFSCTECGRCTAVCPATASGTPLAPRQVILDIRDRLYDHPEEQRAGNGSSAPLISDEALWACTTCMACVEACPVGIEHVPTIIDMRRNLVDQGELDPLLQQTLENYGKQGNSYGKSARMRARWTRGLEFKIPDARAEPVEYVWFVGDFASFDERVQLASRSVARLLHGAGVSFGLLYEGERNSGNDVRRVGEEGLFELLVEQNMGVLADAQFEAIFTTDPHSLNTLRNEYPQFGLDKPTYHYTELLADLVARDAISLRTPLSGTRVTYHDPCYLAPLQPDHRGAAKADRGDGRRARGDAAQRDEHILLRRRRRPDLDDGGRGHRRTAKRAADPRGPDAWRPRLLPGQLPEGPDDVLGRGQGRRRRLRGRGADRADRAGARPGRARPHSPMSSISSSATSNRSASTP